jgi:hypothetical protein
MLGRSISPFRGQASMKCRSLRSRKANTLGKPVERRIFPKGKDERGEAAEAALAAWDV